MGGFQPPIPPGPLLKKAGENQLEYSFGFPAEYAGGPPRGGRSRGSPVAEVALAATGNDHWELWERPLALRNGMRGGHGADCPYGQQKIPAFPAGRRGREAPAKQGRGPLAPALALVLWAPKGPTKRRRPARQPYGARLPFGSAGPAAIRCLP